MGNSHGHQREETPTAYAQSLMAFDMPGIVTALAESGTPFSSLTKGTLLARDIPLLKLAGQSVEVGMGISLAIIDPAPARHVEPGTPSPSAGLDLIRRVRDAGLPCAVMAGAGVTGLTTGALHLRPWAHEWFPQRLGRDHPRLLGKYVRLYGGGAGFIRAESGRTPVHPVQRRDAADVVSADGPADGRSAATPVPTLKEGSKEPAGPGPPTLF